VATLGTDGSNVQPTKLRLLCRQSRTPRSSADLTSACRGPGFAGYSAKGCRICRAGVKLVRLWSMRWHAESLPSLKDARDPHRVSLGSNSAVATVDSAQNQPERPRSRLEEGEFFEAFASKRDLPLTMGFWDLPRLHAPSCISVGWIGLGSFRSVKWWVERWEDRQTHLKKV